MTFIKFGSLTAMPRNGGLGSKLCVLFFQTVCLCRLTSSIVKERFDLKFRFKFTGKNLKSKIEKLNICKLTKLRVSKKGFVSLQKHINQIFAFRAGVRSLFKSRQSLSTGCYRLPKMYSQRVEAVFVCHIRYLLI